MPAGWNVGNDQPRVPFQRSTGNRVPSLRPSDQVVAARDVLPVQLSRSPPAEGGLIDPRQCDSIAPPAEDGLIDSRLYEAAELYDRLLS